MRPVILPALAAMSLLACTAASNDDATSSESAIQGGTLWGGDYAVGMIGFQSGGVCTGTLIAPDVVLTAGHCVQGYEGQMTGFYVGAGAPIVATADDPNPKQIPANLTRYEIDRVALYPGFDASELRSGHVSTEHPDLGLIHLATPVRGIPPRRVVDPTTEGDAVSSQLVVGPSTNGSERLRCDAIGYGRHDEHGVTTVKAKRDAVVSLVAVTPSAISASPASGSSAPGVGDEGDSGGPLLCIFRGLGTDDPTRIVGTASYSLDGTGASHAVLQYVRLEPYAAWIQDALKTFPAEERCAIGSTGMSWRCEGQALEYCDGTRWRTAMTCAAGQTCDAASSCR
ncbi:hypothetical protein AKJ09_11095 [Labilithrix luteola]|uniref:Peptidase S1 domain-containing protein n=1 Tax=Labilithrix luteola TaxID=1391654 RepID=A0A0K1QFK3_9BACT|nr:trypsin-like serine protease [Labilithrix luteola]AKV04432.1 hypothetical protein AKJ09_11095 [Labilithrix luteola]